MHRVQCCWAEFPLQQITICASVATDGTRNINMHGSNRGKGPMTTAIHAGETPDATTGASAPPIHMSSTFVSDDISGFSAHDLTPDSPYAYARWANPTVAMLEAKIAALQGAEECLCTASGMAAASAILFTFLQQGDHAVISDVSYAGVAELARDTLPRMGVEVSLVDLSNPENLARAMRPNTRLVHSESPANPIGRLTDLAAISKIAHDGGAMPPSPPPLGRTRLGWASIW